ncbi:MAG: hypothetical protein V1810_03160 [Candidatus Beckwithbacteria bacterium]
MNKNYKLSVAIAVAVILSFIVFGPVLSRLNQRLAVNRKLKADLASLETKVQVLQGIDKQLIKERATKMEVVFPSQKPVVQILSSLSNLARKHGLTFGGVALRPGELTVEEEKISKDKLKSSSKLLDISFGFEVGGNFNKIIEFLKELESTAPIMRIDNVGLAIKTNPLFEDQATLVLASIDVSAYYQAAPTTLGSISQPVKLLSKGEEMVLNKLFNFTQFQSVLPSAQTGKADLFGVDRSASPEL